MKNYEEELKLKKGRRLYQLGEELPQSWLTLKDQLMIVKNWSLTKQWSSSETESRKILP